MFPINELTKDATKGIKNAIIIFGAAFLVMNMVHTYTAYRLSKVNRELSEIQIRKLKSEGFK